MTHELFLLPFQATAPLLMGWTLPQGVKMGSWTRESEKYSSLNKYSTNTHTVQKTDTEYVCDIQIA